MPRQRGFHDHELGCRAQPRTARTATSWHTGHGTPRKPHDHAHHRRDPPPPALLDTLPVLGDILDSAPIGLQQQLYEAFDLHLLCKSDMHQVSIYATVTGTTAQAIASFLQLDARDTARAVGTLGDSFSDLTQHPRALLNNRAHVAGSRGERT